ncbi:MAG TPA: hypothetical protein PK607_03765, partial [Aggregatilineales bacterium]|nr:hypothetical protein [Aggregatilineales bacterium]
MTALSTPDINSFAEKYLLAIETDERSAREGGTSGLELEWNLYDSRFQPLRTVGNGRSFVDVLREEYVPHWLDWHTKPEVFHWMTEWITRP